MKNFDYLQSLNLTNFAQFFAAFACPKGYTVLNCSGDNSCTNCWISFLHQEHIDLTKGDK